MTKSTLVYPYGSVRLSTCHIWNFKNKEQKTFISSFSEKLKKEATQPAWVSFCLFCFLFAAFGAGCSHRLGMCHPRMEGHACMQDTSFVTLPGV